MAKEQIGGSLQTNVEQRLGISFDNFLKLDYEQQQRLIQKLNDEKEESIEQKESEPKVKKFSLFKKSK